MAYYDDKPRSIRFSQALWDAIDRDAQNAKRSSVKQMELILSLYYGISTSDVDRDRLKEVRRQASIQPIDRLEPTEMEMVKIPVTGELSNETKKKGRKVA